jgi:hypothetical protein
LGEESTIRKMPLEQMRIDMGQRETSKIISSNFCQVGFCTDNTANNTNCIVCIVLQILAVWENTKTETKGE